MKWTLLVILLSGVLWGKSKGVQVGDQAPDFSLPDQDGNVHTLSKYFGQDVVLYFYPKDDTPG